VFSLFKATPENLVRELKDLPPAPRILQKLQKLISAPDSTLAAIADLVVLEPGLSGRLVQIANSTHFSRGAKCDSPLEAIQRVGLTGVKELVTYAVASNLVGRPLAAYGLNAQSLWDRAIACGIAAGYLAQKSGAVDYDDAYTAGLMHGLGLVAIDRHAAKQPKKIKLESSGYPMDFAPAERGFLGGFSHASTGGALLDLWGFSPAIVAAVTYQLSPEDAPEEHRPLAMALATARWARSMLCVKDEIIPALPEQAWLDGAGIKIAEFDDWMNRVKLRFQIASAELRLGS
jgi:HD-like signal output (HDOD) protein